MSLGRHPCPIHSVLAHLTFGIAGCHQSRFTHFSHSAAIFDLSERENQFPGDSTGRINDNDLAVATATAYVESAERLALGSPCPPHELWDGLEWTSFI
jgi:hypothetical protein